MPKPRGDLGALVVPKATAAAAVPHNPGPQPIAQPAPPVPAPTGGSKAKALTVKLDPTTYQRLRRYCAAREDTTGERVTHQEVMVAALLAMLDAGE